VAAAVSAGSGSLTVPQLEARPARRAAGCFTDAELVGLPEPVRRYLAAAIAPGTPLATAARIQMRGHIRVGRWPPFHAREVLAPRRGFGWAGRVAGLIAGCDRYADGAGGLDGKLAGLVRLAHGAGPDVSRSTAGRIRSFLFDRWGDPGRTGRWGSPQCGSVTMPAAGRLGWFYGTERWPAGEFFRYRVTRLRLLGGPGRG
jgi:uncharacterized protein DUF6544